MSKIETPVMTSLQTTAEKMMKDLNVPGAAVAVIKDGEVIISEGFGYRNIETKRLLHRILIRNRFLNESIWHTFIKLVSTAKV